MDTLLPSEADPIQLASTPARGRRPEFTDDPMVDRLYSVALVLSAELAVTRLRLDALERGGRHVGQPSELAHAQARGDTTATDLFGEECDDRHVTTFGDRRRVALVAWTIATEVHRGPTTRVREIGRAHV